VDAVAREAFLRGEEDWVLTSDTVLRHRVLARGGGVGIRLVGGDKFDA
jgi:hypothetical protein